MNQRPAYEPTQEFRALDRVWDNTDHNSQSLGCTQCPYLKDCGGMHVAAGLFDCTGFCTCQDKNLCDMVCPNNPLFVKRFREVNGLSLNNVPRVSVLTSPNLPHFVPFIGNKYSRMTNLQASTVALSLYDVVHMGSRIRGGVCDAVQSLDVD